MPKRVKAKGIHRDEPDSDMIALALWIQSKSVVRRRRADAARARAKRRERGGE
jgi:hypothetical protein